MSTSGNTCGSRKLVCWLVLGVPAFTLRVVGSDVKTTEIGNFDDLALVGRLNIPSLGCAHLIAT